MGEWPPEVRSLYYVSRVLFSVKPMKEANEAAGVCPNRPKQTETPPVIFLEKLKPDFFFNSVEKILFSTE